MRHITNFDISPPHYFWCIIYIGGIEFQNWTKIKAPCISWSVVLPFASIASIVRNFIAMQPHVSDMGAPASHRLMMMNGSLKPVMNSCRLRFIFCFIKRSIDPRFVTKCPAAPWGNRCAKLWVPMIAAEITWEVKLPLKTFTKGTKRLEVLKRWTSISHPPHPPFGCACASCLS